MKYQQDSEITLIAAIAELAEGIAFSLSLILSLFTWL